MYIIFLANSFVCQNGRPNCLFYYIHIEITTIVGYPTLRCSKTCKAHKRNLRIDLKFGNRLILSISTELRHKNIMLGSQNGPLSGLCYILAHS